MKSNLLLISLVLSVLLLPAPGITAAASESGIVITKVEASTVERTWDDIQLLYPAQFHNTTMLQEEIVQIVATAPEIVDLSIIGQTYLGHNISCLRITNELDTREKSETLVIAHHHGREQITVEAALRFIHYLLNNYGEDAQITEYINTLEIYIIPSLNLDALDIVVDDGNHWLRKNLRPYDNDHDGSFNEDDCEDVDGDGQITTYDVYEKSGEYENYLYTYFEGIDNDEDGQINEDEVGNVDLNRNYAINWDGGEGSSAIHEDQTYRGSAAFSEPETQAFRDFAYEHTFAMAYSLHSGINATYFPTYTWQDNGLYNGMYSDLDSMLHPSFNGPNTYPSTSSHQREYESVGSGLWSEWMYHVRGSKAPICFEIYRNLTVMHPDFETVFLENSTHIIKAWKGLYGYFNPVAEYINSLWVGIRPAFDYLLDMTPRLEVDIELVSAIEGATDILNVNTSAICNGRRIGSVDDVLVNGEDDELIFYWDVLSAEGTIETEDTFELPVDLSLGNYSIFVGNDYIGWTEFILSRSGEDSNTGPGLPLDVVTITIVISAVAVIVIVVVFMKRRAV